MARNPKQDANLKPPFTSDQSREEASKNGRKGGKASGASRRAKRDARQAARYILGLAAKGKILENTEALGAQAEDGITNMEALQARLYSMAMSGNLEAYLTLMKMAGYDPKENRDERESLASDRRRDKEVDAKLTALGSAPDSSTMAVNMGNEDGGTDVVIFVPQMLSEEECQVKEEEAEEDTEGDTEQEPADS